VPDRSSGWWEKDIAVTVKTVTFKRTLAAALAGVSLLVATGTALAQTPGEVPADNPNVISMAGNAFSAPEMTVPAGTVVTWVNTDPEAHDVIAADFTSFESPIVNPGETWQFQFDVPGTYAYLCDLHDNMTATITVVDPAAGAPAAEA
jgi:plastocyanin